MSEVLALLAHLSCRLIGELIVFTCIRRLSIGPSVNIFKRHLSNVSPIISILHVASTDGGDEK